MADGGPVIVQMGEGEYAVYVEDSAGSPMKGTPRTSASVSRRRPLFSGYDAQKARAELRRLEGSISREEAAAMIAYIYRAREEGSRPAERP